LSLWIVQLALRRPYTFIVAALLLLFASPLVILRTPVDIFPNIDIPVVSIVFQYTGMPASQFGDRITSPFERLLTTTVNDIEHIESTSLNGISVTKVFFQPNAKLPAALAQVTSISQTVLKWLPTGITPPIIISYNASSVPILQLGLSSDKLGEQELYDLAINYVRASIKGVLTEAGIAALLTATMILLFMGNWRHTLVVAISIPLSILASICTLSFLGETLNIMTLYGSALRFAI
jgi:multidrug efflux pump subunit AcrB